MKSSSSFDSSNGSKSRNDLTRTQLLRQSVNKRKSLADFKEIDDAMGNAFLYAEQTQSGSNDINFNVAVNAQVRFLETSSS